MTERNRLAPLEQQHIWAREQIQQLTEQYVGDEEFHIEMLRNTVESGKSLSSTTTAYVQLYRQVMESYGGQLSKIRLFQQSTVFRSAARGVDALLLQLEMGEIAATGQDIAIGDKTQNLNDVVEKALVNPLASIPQRNRARVRKALFQEISKYGALYTMDPSGFRIVASVLQGIEDPAHYVNTIRDPGVHHESKLLGVKNAAHVYKTIYMIGAKQGLGPMPR